MQKFSPLVLLALAIAAPQSPAVAQEQPTTFVRLSAGLALADHERDPLLGGTAHRIFGEVGRTLGPDFAATMEVGVTTLARRGLVEYPPCTSPGPCRPIVVDASSVTAIGLAPGAQWFTANGARRAAFTISPGLLWFASNPEGPVSVVPQVGARFDLAWRVGSGPRLGISVGATWWDSKGALPRWTVPFGLSVGLH